MAPIYLGKRVVPSSLRYIENLAERMDFIFPRSRLFIEAVVVALRNVDI